MSGSMGTPVVVERPTLRRGRPRDDRLDAVIVSAAVAEVGAKGWGGATIDGIAARAGVGRGTIYRRWPSKTDLFQYAATAVELAALLPSLLAEAANDPSIRQTLRTFVAQSRQQAIEAVERARIRGDIVASTDAETLVDMLAGALVYRRLLLGEATDAAAVRALVRQAVQSCATPTSTEEDS